MGCPSVTFFPLTGTLSLKRTCGTGSSYSPADLRSRERRERRRPVNQFRPRRPRQLRAKGQRLCHDLIHVVVLVSRQAAHKMDTPRRFREFLVLLVKQAVLSARNWIIRVALACRVFVNDARFGVLLARQVLKLGDASISMIVGIVNNRNRLETFARQSLMLEFQAAIRQLAETVFEIFVNRAGKDQLLEGN